jgi:glycosyltransferase involved in cell wall biosynthesis
VSEPPHADVTVVVAAYNHASFVREALDSVASQTLPEAALLVVDDASTDDSAAVISAWLVETDTSADTIFHQQNRGICRTFNEALARVRTPYFTIMSADDRMLPGRLRAQVEVLEASGPDTAAVYSDAWLIGLDGTRTGQLFSASYRFAGRQMPEGRIFRELCHGNWIPAPSVLLRTDLVRAVGAYDESLSFEDYDLWLRLAQRYRFALNPEPVVEYRLSATSATETFSSSVLMGLDLTRSRVKNLGVDAEADEVILDEAEAKLHHAYLVGAEPTTVAPALRAVARRRPRASTLVLAATSTLRVPGRALVRARHPRGGSR